MKILEVKLFYAYSIETDEKENGVYRRISSDCWECLYGESWESVYECDYLEAAFQSEMLDFKQN